MVFKDRTDAGCKLAEKLVEYKNFNQVSDEEVKDLLEKAKRPSSKGRPIKEIHYAEPERSSY